MQPLFTSIYDIERLALKEGECFRQKFQDFCYKYREHFGEDAKGMVNYVWGMAKKAPEMDKIFISGMIAYFKQDNGLTLEAKTEALQQLWEDPNLIKTIFYHSGSYEKIKKLTKITESLYWEINAYDRQLKKEYALTFKPNGDDSLENFNRWQKFKSTEKMKKMLAEANRGEKPSDEDMGGMVQTIVDAVLVRGNDICKTLEEATQQHQAPVTTLGIIQKREEKASRAEESQSSYQAPPLFPNRDQP